MIAVIGGSGFYNFLEKAKLEEKDTPFGKVAYEYGTIKSEEIIFLPRHGQKHSVLPSQINYRANIYLTHLLDVEKILVTNAVGSLDYDIKPGSFVIPDQIIDFTSGRENTFFNKDGFKTISRTGKILTGIIHSDMTEPLNNTIRKEIRLTCQKLNQPVIDGGTIGVTNGPRFETPAEIKAYRILGVDLVGMTSAPEAFLAKELEIPYASLGVVTNYAAGMQNEINQEEVFELFKENIEMVKNIFSRIISDNSINSSF